MLRVVLFRSGRAGVIVCLPGKNPEEELSMLLGGAIEMLPISERLLFVALADREKLKLPFRYLLLRDGVLDKPVDGDCAVAAFDAVSEQYTDVNTSDYIRARKAVVPLGTGRDAG